nr:protein S100-A7-like isoform X2 [Dasypus novemcinctus]
MDEILLLGVIGTLGSLVWWLTIFTSLLADLAFLKVKMNNTPAEKNLLSLITLFHKYSGDDDVIDKKSMSKLMEDNFPNFLICCKKKGTDLFCKIFERNDKNKDDQIEFAEFLSVIGEIATDFHEQSHGAPPCSDPSQGSQASGQKNQ